MNLFDALKTGRRFRENSTGLVGEWRSKESLEGTLFANAYGCSSPGTDF